MKATAVAPSNIAFIKYWGKRNAKLRLPDNSSISMNLSNVYTTTSVEFKPRLKSDKVIINGQKVKGEKADRVTVHLDRVRKIAKLEKYATVHTENNFPTGAGIASSASGFAALSLAATKAAELDLTERGLSILARLGSGSACRSIPDGFVEWVAGSSSDTSYAKSLYPSDYWDISDVVVIVAQESKKVSSSEGHELAQNSPFFNTRLHDMLPKRIKMLKMALAKRDFTQFGEIIEREALEMHAIALTSSPYILYWYPGTVSLMGDIADWRSRGLEVYFTIDAGSNLHVICQGKDVAKIKARLKKSRHVKDIIANKPAGGARILLPSPPLN